jgi:hypothetical protein
MATAMTTAAAGTAPRPSAYGRAGVHDLGGTLTVKEPIVVVGQIIPSNTKPDQPAPPAGAATVSGLGTCPPTNRAEEVRTKAVAPGSEGRIRGQ